jgi:hypothetical protein
MNLWVEGQFVGGGSVVRPINVPVDVVITYAKLTGTATYYVNSTQQASGVITVFDGFDADVITLTNTTWTVNHLKLFDYINTNFSFVHETT